MLGSHILHEIRKKRYILISIKNKFNLIKIVTPSTPFKKKKWKRLLKSKKLWHRIKTEKTHEAVKNNFFVKQNLFTVKNRLDLWKTV